MESSNTFDWPEYVVFGSVMVLSTGVGIFYGCFGSKQNTNEEFLMGNRQMSPFPVALSLVASYISANTFLGSPSEVYLYGAQYLMMILSLVPITLCLVYLYVPVFYELKLTSAFEYLELRFNRNARVAVSVIAMVYYIVNMALIVYGPSLALSQVTGMHHRISVVLIFAVCIFYSTLGGIKSVVATDGIQCFIMIGSLLVVVGKGISDLGGVDYVWSKAENGSRVDIFNFDFDPRTRYTIWGAAVGEFFGWLGGYAASQVNIQRFGTIGSLSGVTTALIYNLIGLALIVILVQCAGLIVYAKYASCDPIASHRVTRADQLLPLFVMDTLDGTPGLPGLFVAGVVCASLSTVSSCLNALAAMISEDFIKFYRPKYTDETMASISRVICVLTGIVAYACTFGAETTESVYEAGTGLMGSTLGPTLGIFSIGMFYPFANSKGALMGLLLGISTTAFMTLGAIVEGGNLPNQKLPLSTEGCLNFNSTEPIMDDGLYWKDKEYGFLTNIFAISYLWVSGIGCTITFIFGALFSLFFKNEPDSLNKRCISPPFFKLWMKCYPEKFTKRLRKPSTSPKKQLTVLYLK